ncbi:hypothetical protein [Allorhizobium ampelinum]|uniref:hypothetical protein n=1 Tax=Allorhizobium ampelinum TaxID=3025782 RepID=UPI001F448896|nr:hypothetical protein [Allorhizobium ampelinum]
MVLPVTLEHHGLEAPIDFVARLAVANGFSSLRDFLAHTEISARAIISGDVDGLAVVAEWSGVPAARLARWTVAGRHLADWIRHPQQGHASWPKDALLCTVRS